MAKKKNIIIKQGLDGWVMTYGDMMSLLLTFFVLIVSFSSMQETKFEQAAASLKEAFGVLNHPESVIEFNTPLVPNHWPTEDESEVLYEVRSVEKFILDEGLQEQVEVQLENDGVVFRLNAPLLFDSGGADLRQEPRPILEKLAQFFRKFPYEVAVEGHTDSAPIHTERFPSNWELSAARAVAVARYFQGLGMPPQRLTATGFGEYRPIADNADAAGRARNRRVEIFLQLKQENLPRAQEMTFTETAAAVAAPVPEEPPTAAENSAVRPIINPVTDRLLIPALRK